MIVNNIRIKMNANVADIYLSSMLIEFIRRPINSMTCHIHSILWHSISKSINKNENNGRN